MVHPSCADSCRSNRHAVCTQSGGRARIENRLKSNPAGPKPAWLPAIEGREITGTAGDGACGTRDLRTGFDTRPPGVCPGGKQMIPDTPLKLHIVSVAKFALTSHRTKLKFVIALPRGTEVERPCSDSKHCLRHRGCTKRASRPRARCRDLCQRHPGLSETKASASARQFASDREMALLE